MHIVREKKKINWLTFTFFVNIKKSGSNRVRVLIFRIYSYVGGGEVGDCPRSKNNIEWLAKHFLD